MVVNYRISMLSVFLGILISAGFVLVCDQQACASVSQVIGTARGDSYMLCDNYGGTWYDTEKSPLTNQDDSLCWAAAAANALQWTGWGKASGLTTNDQIFTYLQDHWTNNGGSAKYAWQWWFSGEDNAPRTSGWAHVDVAGGGFLPNSIFDMYYDEHTMTYFNSMDYVKDYLRGGSSVILLVYNDNGAHAITCWGYSYDPITGQYNGVWVTDSDDDKNNPDAPDTLRYYDVAYSNYAWHLQNFYGTNSWYIGGVEALAAPEPMTLTLLAIGSLAIMRRRRTHV
jgi:hypothetical protein